MGSYKCRLFLHIDKEGINTEMYYRDILLPFVPVPRMRLDGVIEQGNDLYGDVRIEDIVWDTKLEQFEIRLESIKEFPLHPDWEVYEENTPEKWNKRGTMRTA